MSSKKRTSTEIKVAFITAAAVIIAAVIAAISFKSNYKITQVTVKAVGLTQKAERQHQQYLDTAESVWGADDGFGKQSMWHAPSGWHIENFTSHTDRELGGDNGGLCPGNVSVVRDGADPDKLNTNFYVKHGPWHDRYRCKCHLLVDIDLVQTTDIPYESTTAVLSEGIPVRVKQGLSVVLVSDLTKLAFGAVPDGTKITGYSVSISGSRGFDAFSGSGIVTQSSPVIAGEIKLSLNANALIASAETKETKP